jgi:hypothetical protein
MTGLEMFAYTIDDGMVRRVVIAQDIRGAIERAASFVSGVVDGRIVITYAGKVLL